MSETRRRVVAALLAAVGLACVVAPRLAARPLLQEAATRSAGVRVDASIERTQDTFLGLSAAKAGIAVIEGSSVGLGFELQVGDVVQPILDLLDVFWRVFLVAFLILGAYKLLMETGIPELGIAVLGVALALVAVSLVAPRARQPLRNAARVAALAGLLVAYVVPLSLLVTDWVARSYTQPLASRYREVVSEFGEKLDAARESIVDPDVTPPWYHPGQRVGDFRERVTEGARYIGNAFDAALPSFGFYALLALFDHLVLPFLSAFLLYRLTSLTLTRLL